MQQADKLIEEYIGDWRTGWSMGSFGAVAEFHRDETEPAAVENGDRISVATERGSVAFDRIAIGAIIPVAYETLSPKRHRWTHAVALCLPEASAKRETRARLAELGPDKDAARPVDRGDVLFDLGLGLPQSDFCIRTKDPDLLAALRGNLGRSLFEPGNPALGALLAAHPHRVVVTNIGRVEVYQKIGGPETGGVSPEGPHTHLLPKLLKSGRTHSANTPIPEGLLPLGALHPANPVMNAIGKDRPFDPELHAMFQALLADYGLPEIVETKAWVGKALDDGLAPETFALPLDRFMRAAVRLALRQQARVAQYRGDEALLHRLAAWQRVHDPVTERADEDDDAPGH